VRCFCDVRDVTAALPKLIAGKGCAGRVFNLGSDQPLTMVELADAVIRTLASRSGKRFIPYDQAYAAGFEDLRRRIPDLTRIREAIGFAPACSLEQTIKDIARSMGWKDEVRQSSGGAAADGVVLAPRATRETAAAPRRTPR